MPSNHVLLTIITVVRNAENEITDTLASVRRHRADDVQYIVVDGLSTDGTLVIVQTFADCIDVFVSEPDDGIYDAMNKAMRHARGEFVLHLNAGDSLLRIPRDELSSADGRATVLAFPVRLSSNKRFIPRSGRLLSIINTVHHQGAFYRRATALPYDLNYRTFSDFDLNQRMSQGLRVFPKAPPVAFHSLSGQSQDRRHFREVYQIVRKRHGLLHVGLTWALCKLRGARRRLELPFHSPS